MFTKPRPKRFLQRGGREVGNAEYTGAVSRKNGDTTIQAAGLNQKGTVPLWLCPGVRC